MSKMKVSLFYRDGGNYKCSWDVELEESVINDLVDGEDINDFIDKDFSSDDLFEIEDMGLTVDDIPNIRDYGFNDLYDHNFVSITNIERI